MGKRKTNRKDTEKANIISALLSTTVIAAIVSGIFSLLVVHYTNEQLTRIESQKYAYEVQYSRYEELQEFLIFFSEFRVYSPEFINSFSYSSETSITDQQTIFSNSTSLFCSKLLQLNPYLSDNAVSLLEKSMQEKEFLSDFHEVNVDDMLDLDDIDNAMKEHMRFVNDEYNELALEIVRIISYDIYSGYVGNSDAP